MNEAPISPPDLQAQAGSGRTVVGHIALSKAYALETYRPRGLQVREAFAFHEHGSPVLVTEKQERNSSNARLSDLCIAAYL